LQSVTGLDLAGVVATAADALAAFELHRPDGVILDLVLRAGTGLDALHGIKQRASACRVLVFTTHDEEPYRIRCLAAGTDHFFSKSRQHQAQIQELHNLGGDAPAATGRPADADPSDSANF
jgi:DNA-binding NarL/FixJ family response regulator